MSVTPIKPVVNLSGEELILLIREGLIQRSEARTLMGLGPEVQKQPPKRDITEGWGDWKYHNILAARGLYWKRFGHDLPENWTDDDIEVAKNLFRERYNRPEKSTPETEVPRARSGGQPRPTSPQPAQSPEAPPSARRRVAKRTPSPAKRGRP